MFSAQGIIGINYFIVSRGKNGAPNLPQAKGTGVFKLYYFSLFIHIFENNIQSIIS